MTHSLRIRWSGLTALLAAALLFAGPAAAQDKPAAEQPAPVEGAVRGDLPLGSADAAVEIVEYASLTCPHCASFHAETYDALKEKYVDTGKVRFVFRDFPFDRLALMGSVLARCAGPDRYHGMLKVLFRQQTGWARAEDPLAALLKIARMGGIGEERVKACFMDESLVDVVLQQRLDGQQKHNVESTPTFIVNGEKHTGALSLERFDAILGPLVE